MCTGGQLLANEIHHALDGVLNELNVDLDYVLHGREIENSEPGATNGSIMEQIGYVVPIIETFDETDRTYFEALHYEARRGSSNFGEYVALVVCAVTTKYPVIDWRMNVRLIRRAMERHAGCIRRLDKPSPRRDLYEKMQTKPDVLARMINDSWKGCKPCPYLQQVPLLVAYESTASPAPVKKSVPSLTISIPLWRLDQSARTAVAAIEDSLWSSLSELDHRYLPSRRRRRLLRRAIKRFVRKLRRRNFITSSELKWKLRDLDLLDHPSSQIFQAERAVALGLTGWPPVIPGEKVPSKIVKR